MKKGLLVFFSFFLVSLVFCKTTYAAVTWTETQPAGNADHFWASERINLDGSILLAGDHSGRLYVSSDSASTWNEVQPAGDSDNQWFVTGVSSNGQKMIAGNYGGRFYVSNDTGKTWTDTQAAGNVDSNWNGGAISGDGQTIIAGVNPGRLYISTDGGSTWSETRPAGNTDENWIPMAVSGNGQVILAGVYGGRLYRSTNRGSSWVEIGPAGNTDLNWNTIGMDKNGQTMLIGVDDAGDEIVPRTGKLYLSKNEGNSWSEVVIAGTNGREWRISSLSDDGQTMLVGYGDGTTEGRIFLSTNNGNGWEETQPAGNNDYLWYTGAVSGDGYTLVAAVGTNLGTSRMYVGVLPRPAPPIPAPPGPPGCSDSAPGSAPNLFQLRAKGNSVTLYFAPDGGSNSGYYIGYGFDATAQNFGTSFNYTNSGGAVAYTINDLFPGTWYFKVRGQNGCMPGMWSGAMKIHVTKFGTHIVNAIQ